MRARFIQNDILAYLQDYKLHTMQEICNELSISRSTRRRHINDLTIHYNIQTFVGGRNSGGIKLLGNKQIEVCLNNNELQLVVGSLASLQGVSPNIDKFISRLSHQITNKEQ